MEYRKKPVVIEAFRYGMDSRPDWFDTKVTSNEIITYVGTDIRDLSQYYCEIKTLEGTMRGNCGDYIIKGVKGEVYACKPDIFEMTYELASTSSQTEISDEEIENFLKSFPYTKHLDDGQYNDGVIVGAELGIEWYREQLKKK